MNCVMTRGMYLRADGRLPCYCSAGETLTLARLDHGHLPADLVRDVFRSPAFTRIRESMAQGKAPFPGICEQCSYLDVEEPIPANLEDEVLEWLHLEPSYLCNLDCRWCHGQERPTQSKAGLLPLGTVRRLAEDFADSGYRLVKGNICGVGEPTLNPDVWRMTAALKGKLGGDILLSTNGNGPYSPEILECGLDKIKIAADAATQEAYGRYRRNGRLGRVLDFTAKLAGGRQRANQTTPRIIWQYILFNYNDSDEELMLYQKLAREHGVDMLRIVYTRCDNYSRRSPADFPDDFPEIVHFPIKDQSLLGVEEASRRCEAVERLADVPHGVEQAATGAMALANHIVHRLLLGVERYADLLDFSVAMRPLAGGNLADLSPEEFRGFRELLGRLFRMLAGLRRRQGDLGQAQAYLRFVESRNL